MKSKKVISFVIILTMMMSVFAIPCGAAWDDGLRAGEYYFIKNVGSGRYMDVANGADANYTNVLTYGFNGNYNQQWRVIKPGSSYKLGARCSSSGRILDVTNNNVDIYQDGNASYQLFSISRNSDGTYRIANGNSYVAENSSNNNVELSPTYSDSYSKWTFERVSKGDADIYAFNYSGYDSTAANSTFKTYANEMGYSAYAINNSNYSNAYTNILGDDIWVHNGPGTAGNLAFISGNGVTNGKIELSDINGLPVNALASMRIFVTTASYAANDTNGAATGSANNFLHAVVNRGAHFAFASRDDVPTVSGSKWLNSFMYDLKTGANVKQSIEYATFFAYLGSQYYVGDSNQRLN